MSSSRLVISWKRGRMYSQPGNSFYDLLWKKAKAKHHTSVADASYTYWSHITDAASIVSFARDKESELLSAEALPENSSMIGFKTFARDYPEKLFPLISKLRAEFQELFIEYYLLEKSQSFIGQVHGQIQTRVWQNLRIIEQSIGSLILLGTDPDETILRPILEEMGLEETQYGSLTFMILKYAENQNYAEVAVRVGAPIPAIRKIFRPAIATLLASKNVRAVAVGAYLRSLTHQASLTGAGLSKRCIARTRRVKTLRFTAPSADNSPLISFGAVSVLRDTPWCMFEISSDQQMSQITQTLKKSGRQIFGKKAAQVFAPLNSNGELAFQYIFARSVAPGLTRSLMRVRGISEMAATYDREGTCTGAITISHDEVKEMIKAQKIPESPCVRAQDFVEILTGPAAKYCGTVIRINTISDELTVDVSFPTGRHFIVTADPTCVKLLPKVPAEQRAFWGVKN